MIYQIQFMKFKLNSDVDNKVSILNVDTQVYGQKINRTEEEYNYRIKFEC